MPQGGEYTTDGSVAAFVSAAVFRTLSPGAFRAA
jgi:hypothetical protein